MYIFLLFARNVQKQKDHNIVFCRAFFRPLSFCVSLLLFVAQDNNFPHQKK